MKFNCRIIQAAVFGMALFWNAGAWAQAGHRHDDLHSER